VRLYTWRRTGLADEVGCDAIPDAAGGEGGHGAAKPDGVIPRYVNYQMWRLRATKQSCKLSVVCKSYLSNRSPSNVFVSTNPSLLYAGYPALFHEEQSLPTTADLAQTTMAAKSHLKVAGWALSLGMPRTSTVSVQAALRLPRYDDDGHGTHLIDNPKPATLRKMSWMRDIAVACYRTEKPLIAYSEVAKPSVTHQSMFFPEELLSSYPQVSLPTA
jgi:hypothetical protein